MVNTFVRRHKPEAVVCDLDGCLADYGDRSPFDGHLCATDTLVEPVRDVLDALSWHRDRFVLILSGRNEGARRDTENWLERHNVPYHSLYLRKHMDWRPAPEYKRDILTTQILPLYDVRLVLEDDPRVAEMCRELGLPCFLVAPYRECAEEQEKETKATA